MRQRERGGRTRSGEGRSRGGGQAEATRHEVAELLELPREREVLASPQPAVRAEPTALRGVRDESAEGALQCIFVTWRDEHARDAVDHDFREPADPGGDDR